MTLSESGFVKNLGFNVKQQSGGVRKDAYWFGEAQGRVVVTVSADNTKEFENSLKVPFEKLGVVTSEDILIDGENWGNVNDWKEKYDNAIGDFLKLEE